MTFVLRLLTLPLRLLGRTAARTGTTAVGSFRLGYRAGRLVGYGRLLLVALGVAVGVLVAPGPGSELRSRLARFVRQQRGEGSRGALVPPTAMPGDRPAASTPDSGGEAAPAPAGGITGGAPGGAPAAPAPVEDLEDLRPPTGPDAVDGAVGVPGAEPSGQVEAGAAGVGGDGDEDGDDTGELPRPTFE